MRQIPPYHPSLPVPTLKYAHSPPGPNLILLAGSVKVKTSVTVTALFFVVGSAGGTVTVTVCFVLDGAVTVTVTVSSDGVSVGGTGDSVTVTVSVSSDGVVVDGTADSVTVSVSVSSDGMLDFVLFIVPSGVESSLEEFCV